MIVTVIITETGGKGNECQCVHHLLAAVKSCLSCSANLNFIEAELRSGTELGLTVRAV